MERGLVGVAEQKVVPEGAFTQPPLPAAGLRALLELFTVFAQVPWAAVGRRTWPEGKVGSGDAQMPCLGLRNTGLQLPEATFSRGIFIKELHIP